MRPSCEFTRRGMLLLTATGGLGSLLRAESADFWNKKDPASWSADEVDRLLTKSPWAKEITVSGSRPRDESSGGGGGRGTGSTLPGGIGIPGSGGRGMGIPGIGRGGGGGRGGRGGSGGRPAPMQFHSVVRWESAQPVLEALKTTLPGTFSDHYVISVSGIPLFGRDDPASEEEHADAATQHARDAVLERLTSFTQLEKKGASPLQPGVVEQNPVSTGAGVTVLFGFSKDLLPITPRDEEITFSTRIGGNDVKVKFDLRKMVYHQALAI